MNKQDISELQHVIGYTFNDISLLYNAMTHSSYAHDNGLSKEKCNERLEFLGDAVLELISSEYLFDNYPNKTEGELTKIRASLVSEQPLAYVAKEIGLGEYVFLSNGEDKGGGRLRPSITSDAVEALLGAIYLDGGIDKAREFVYKYIVNDIENKNLFYDAKTILQEIVQKYKLGELKYVEVEERGPEHMKEYTFGCTLDGKRISTGTGSTKKQAEQKSAYKAILKLKNENR
ncbi:MAG: ribonuclease III [Lachnospiraceae bacterium]|nr:ribonuclease III [Lachnospiraceae bacterium]MBQ5474926.1 ribonuclease III [Lachnospiraceae bacterium]